jgi:hypothetical protein
MPNPIKLDDVGNSSDSSNKITIGPVSAGNSPMGNGGSMGNIFTQSQAKREESKLISSIISQREVAQKSRAILGPAPTLEKSIEQEKEAANKRKLRFYQFIFVLIFVAGAAMALYYYSELSPDFNLFGQNTTQRLADTNDSLRKVQAQVNRDHYLSAQLELNEFSYESDRFLSSVQKMNDPTVSDVDKRAVLADQQESEEALPSLLNDVRTILNQNIVPTTYASDAEAPQTPDSQLQAAQSDLRNDLNDEKTKYGTNPTSPQDIQDLKMIANAVKLVGNTALLNVLQNTSSDALQKQLADYAQSPDATKLLALQTLTGQILASTKSDLATIANIKQQRIDWQTIIGQIKDVTRTPTVDPNFGDEPSLYDTVGGVVYNGYEFDSDTDKIVLSGAVKTNDGSNFTLMSNLLDALGSSPYFQDVEMRSFSKSQGGGQAGSGYLSNFKIDLSLASQNASSKNTPISLQNAAAITATGTKRTTAGAASDATQPAAVTPTLSPSAATPASTQQAGSTTAASTAPASAAAPTAPANSPTPAAAPATVTPPAPAASTVPAASVTPPASSSQAALATPSASNTSGNSSASSLLDSLFSAGN